MKKINLSDIGIIFFLALFVSGVMLASFASKSLSYEKTNDTIQLKVQKKEFSVFAQTNGILVSSTITVGQHVTAGQVIGQLENENLDKQIVALRALNDNASALVQLSQLQAEKAAQTLYSPTDGIVASTATQGEAINNVQEVAVIYSDDAVQLLGNFNYSNYNLFQQNTANISATSLRDGQLYAINYGGTLQKITKEEEEDDDSYVTLFFTFDNANDAVNVLQDEELSMPLVNNGGNKKPIDAVRDWFDDSIFSR